MTVSARSPKIASAARPGRAKLGETALALASTLALGCAGASAPPVLSPMEPLPSIGNYVPDENDALAAAACVAD